jgi:hypothetical protein
MSSSTSSPISPSSSVSSPGPSPLEASLVQTHPFRFTPVFQLGALPFGVRPDHARVELVGTHFTARYGPWTVSTPIDNIASVGVSGPFAWFKVGGPPRLSLADRGLTFGSNSHAGVCLRFNEPVRGIDPFGLVRHPGLTVTVDDPDALVAEIEAARSHHDDLERDERTVLENQTSSQLRALARAAGVRGASSMKKPDLVAALLANDDRTETALRAELDLDPEGDLS